MSLSDQPISREALQRLHLRRQEALMVQAQATALAAAFDAELARVAFDAGVALEEWNFDLRRGLMTRKEE